ncbi:type III-B CRISPR module-associated Cmr3 family protein [Runella zeae]|uniref:type III-B CRISPR module-associated Cmr3 family protein n=1 Tax=Runella zeae TaxID=94255 RepID=UPI00040CE84B|nr:type III-B CRISPR module-associated Cmr3 family protein [Runella zeae]
MSNETTYLIQLRPRGRFFFGGDRAFTATGEAVYSAESLYFPQQTALLGMLRYAMIRQNQKAAIGQGFDHSVEPQDWGEILKLSPVFLIDTLTQTQWLPLGMNFQHDPKSKQVVELQLPVDKRIENYNPKNGFLKNQWTNGTDVCSVQNFFNDIETVGNKKDRQGKSQIEGFFKQKAYRLVRSLDDKPVDLSFGFYATFKQPQAFDKVSSVVLGIDQSVFGFLAKIEASPFAQSQTPSEAKKLVLISDAYITDYAALQTHCDFILGDCVPFRYMTPVKNNDYFTEKRRSPKQFNLLARGTVLFPKDINEVINLLQSPTAFRQVGYNHFKIL